MKKKGLFILVMMLCSASIMVFANGSSEKTKAQSGETSIKLALWDYDVEGSVYPEVISQFQAKYPDIKVEVINASANDYETKLTTMLASGDGVDVFFAKSNTSYPTLVQKHFALDLNAVAKSHDYDLAPYGSVLAQHYIIDDGLYALPFRTNDWVIYYNKDMFDAAGVSYPTNDMTWEQFFTIGKGLSHDDTYGCAFFPKAGFIIPCLVGSVDGFDITTSDFSELIPAAEQIKAAMDNGSWENFAESVSLSKDQTYFYQGKWGMFYDGSWLTQLLESQDLGFSYGIVKSPYWAGTTKKGFATSTPVLINAKTKNLEASWKLLTFLCGEEGATTVAKSMLVPGYMDDSVMEAFKNSTGLDQSSQEALTNNNAYGLGKANAYLGLISGAMNQEFELFITDNQSAEQMASNLNKRRAEILEQY
ncbi:extracellular solute-binding protein [uncultured Sphaerochaeta sp.]|uniref:ABC transporter substrate-binding protein n=1 Tax=uncultured Sphaerochaeta sp. TaxID=886478 RepID=UPI002A0A60E0|nr:extracellular solute-binding protein [uncultured Sphaerochaeta sp.]